MSGRVVRAFAIVVALAPLSLVAAGAASAVGPGTFTRITTPSTTTIYPFDGNPSATNNLTVSGETSNDVTSVDITCIYLSHGAVHSGTLAPGVPVTGGQFSTVVSLAARPNCRLRAIPTGVDTNTDYLGAYAGPILYVNTVSPTMAASTTVAYSALSEEGTGIAGVSDAGSCGVQLLATITTPTMTLEGPPDLESCVFALPSGNITSTGTSTASAIRVDGRNAYLPAAVNAFLKGTQGLGVTQSRLAVSFTRHASGDLTIQESAHSCGATRTTPIPRPLQRARHW